MNAATAPAPAEAGRPCGRIDTRPGCMSKPSESPIVARVLALIAKQGMAPQSTSSAADTPERAALLARLAVATGNQERWDLCEAIEALPPVWAIN